MESANLTNEWLNYHHLRYFHAVAREGSVSRASEKLRTSQPSICAQVKQLEAALGDTLYRRRGRSIVLTDFGRTIYGYAEEIFALGSELLTTAKRAPTARTLRLHVGIVDSFPKLLSLDVLRPVLMQVPRVQITCQEGKLDDLLGQLAAHRLDALLADEPPAIEHAGENFQPSARRHRRELLRVSRPRQEAAGTFSAKLAGCADASTHPEHRVAARPGAMVPPCRS
jgi:DNA-binding transcriptional LysR family regulator